MKNEITKAEKNPLFKEAMKEIQIEVKGAKKEKVKRLIKQIRMAELTVAKLKENLQKLLDGDELTEEEYLFGSD